MRRRPTRQVERKRVKSGPARSRAADGCNGLFQCGDIRIIASDGGGWDHVSVSLPYRCPTWGEMEWARGQFWSDDECVVQFSPPRYDERINNHPHCLHMWKKQGSEYELPPTIFVGVPDRKLSSEEQETADYVRRVLSLGDGQ